MTLKRTKRRTITETTSVIVTGQDLIALLKRTGEIEKDANVDDIIIDLPGEGRQLSLIGDVDLNVLLIEEVSVDETEDEGLDVDLG